ncbi:MAG: twin-arginine translocation signal domain-containing protein [Vicinamibacterales bacterium]
MTKKASSRRTFLKAAAGVAAGTMLGRTSLGAQGRATSAATPVGAFPRIDQKFMISPEVALEWNTFKATKCGPTYAGSAGWKQFTDHLISKMHEFGAVDLEYIDMPYDRYVVDDWPDRRTHRHDSGIAVEKLVSDGKPVPVVASYGMTSGHTPADGLTAQMIYFDPAHPPADSAIAGKILVCETERYPDPPYDDRFLDNYTLTDYEWRSPGKWHPLFVPPPPSVTSSFHGRYCWSQLGRFARIAIKGKAAGMVHVYNLSPGAALGLTQRSVYTVDGTAKLGAQYVNCPTLTLDRVNGAKVLADAKAGRRATLTLIARFQVDTGRAIVAHLPGKNYGTAADEQVVLATHTDAMSLIEENGGYGMVGIMSYLNHIPRAQRDRTILFYFDCRHFMPGAEAAWPQYDYFNMHPEKVKSIVATIGMEHMGGRQTIEAGPGGNEYTYSKERPEDGGVITSLIDINNNNIWLVEAIARAATDNQWPRVDVKTGRFVAPGVNGGLQGSVKSPMNKGREFDKPGMGLAGDWPGGWTQTFAQLDTEAGLHGFDEHYFVQQVAGLSQMAGEFMRVKPIVIDLGWGHLKTALVKIADSGYAKPSNAATQRKALLDQYVTAFRKVEAGAYYDAQAALKTLGDTIAGSLAAGEQPALKKLVDEQMVKLAQPA